MPGNYKSIRRSTRYNGGKAMNKQAIKFTSIMGLLIALVLALIPAQVLADDIDADGIPDALEVVGGPGITLPPGANRGDTDSETFLPCVGDPLSSCLSLGTVDLFFIFRPADPTLITTMTPMEILDLISISNAESGLNINVHVIDEFLAGTDREILCDQFDGADCAVPVQKAVRITENTTTPQPILGYCPQGTPMDRDDATVYTGEIQDYVSSVCAGKTCQAYVGEETPTNLVTGVQEVVAAYISYVIIHEVGHTLELAVEYNRRFGGNHTKTGTNFILDQTVVVKESKKSNSMTFYFPNQFSVASQEGIALY